MTNPYDQPTEYVSTTPSWFNPNGTAHYARPVPQPDIYVETNNTLDKIIAGDPIRVAKLESLVKEKRAREKATTKERRTQHEAKEAAAAAKATEEKRQREFAAAIKQHQDEEFAAIDRRRRAQYEAAMNQEVEEDVAAAAAALRAKEAQDYHKWRDYNFQRYVYGNEKTAAEKREEEELQEKYHGISSRLASRADHKVMLADCHLQLDKWDLQRNARMDSKTAFDAFYSVENKPRRAGAGAQTSSDSEPDAGCDFDHCHGLCANAETA